MTTTASAPKSVQQFIDAAREAGLIVKVEHHETVNAWGVYVERRDTGASASVHWSDKNVASPNSRLGFQTTFKNGFRFDYAEVCVPRGTFWQGKETRYPVVRSLRQVRGLLNF